MLSALRFTFGLIAIQVDKSNKRHMVRGIVFLAFIFYPSFVGT
jgi:hypothetical protein